MIIKGKIDVLDLQLNDYSHYTDWLVDYIYSHQQVSAVYQLGGWSQPGISDIDLIVVTKRGNFETLDLSKSSLARTKEENYMLMHPPFVIPEDVFKYLDVFFYCSDLKLRRGKSINLEVLNKNFKRDIEYHKVISFLFHTYPRFNSFRSAISLRSFLTFAYSLKHTYMLIREINKSFESSLVDGFIKMIIDLRKQSLSFEERPDNFIDLTQLISLGKESCKIMLDEINEQVTLAYNFQPSDSNDIYYIKNESTVYHFSGKSEESSLTQLNRINYLNVPEVFALFIILPFRQNSFFSNYQKKNTVGRTNLNFSAESKKLSLSMGHVKLLYDQYHYIYQNCSVINGMPFELNTTNLWLPKLFESKRIINNLVTVKRFWLNFKLKHYLNKELERG